MNIFLGILLIISPGAAIFLIAIFFNALHQKLKKNESKTADVFEEFPHSKLSQDTCEINFRPDSIGSIKEQEFLNFFHHRVYDSVPLMTEHEFSNYKILYSAATSLNLKVFVKVRLLDLIDVDKISIVDEKSQNSFRRLIWAKHVDFVLWEPQRNQVLCVIELDDKTHDKPNRKVRDSFVEKVLTDAGYTYLHYFTFYETAMYYRLKHLLSITF